MPTHDAPQGAGAPAATAAPGPRFFPAKMDVSPQKVDKSYKTKYSERPVNEAGVGWLMGLERHPPKYPLGTSPTVIAAGSVGTPSSFGSVGSADSVRWRRTRERSASWFRSVTRLACLAMPLTHTHVAASLLTEPPPVGAGPDALDRERSRGAPLPPLSRQVCFGRRLLARFPCLTPLVPRVLCSARAPCPSHFASPCPRSPDA